MTDHAHPRVCTVDDPIGRPFEAFLDSKAVTGSGETRSGKYARQLERVVGDWIEQMNNRGVTTFGDLDGQAIAQWTDEYLARRVRARNSGASTPGISAATANVYYDYVSSYLEYCRTWELLDENPAATAVARDPLPDRPSRQASEQQFWSPQERMVITRYVRQRAGEAIDERGADALNEVRDHALIYTIGYSGARGAEILRVPRGDDRRRTGVTWEDIDLDEGTLLVLGKDQDYEQVPLTDKPLPPLRRLREVLNPASDEWPIFTTSHTPTLWSSARDQLSARDHTAAAAEELLESFDQPLQVYRAHDLIPPALTTEGARHLLQKFTEAVGIEVSGDKDYLTLHGARRGVGEQYYREESPAAAQRALRHDDPRTTSEMYAHIEASELSDVGSDIFDGE